MQTDLNLITQPYQRGGSAEIFDPINAWTGAPSGPTGRIYIDVNRTPYGLLQTGYDPITTRQWMRYMVYEGASWTAWRTFEGALVPDPPLPTFAQSQQGSTAVEVFFTITLDSTSTPLASAFTVTGKTISAVVVAPSGRPNVVRLTINTPLGGAATVSYTKPAPPTLKSSDAVEVANFSNLAINQI